MMKKDKAARVVVILSITSDIGLALAKRYSREGYSIVGTYRSEQLLGELQYLPDCRLFYCDINKKSSVSKFIRDYAKLGLAWNIFISCPCTPLPLRPFFGCDFEEWSNSVHINAIEQLRVLHKIYPYRDKAKKLTDVVFFAGGGVNNAVINFSAYTISKIMLIKMCEFLDAENKDMNFFIVGPGWTRTKTHNLILENVGRSDEKYRQTLKFMKSGAGTSMDDIYDCINSLISGGKKIASGRNFAVVNDKWRGKDLAEELLRDPDMYKLRRYRNNWETTEKRKR